MATRTSPEAEAKNAGHNAGKRCHVISLVLEREPGCWMGEIYRRVNTENLSVYVGHTDDCQVTPTATQ